MQTGACASSTGVNFIRFSSNTSVLPLFQNTLEHVESCDWVSYHANLLVVFLLVTPYISMGGESR